MLDPRQTFWDLAYLTDDEKLVARDPVLIRRKCGASQHWKAVSLSETAWNGLESLSNAHAPFVWDRILLDAIDMWPDTAASISLANAALETFSSWLVEQFASLSQIDANLWAWINDRRDWYQEPSVEERFDNLLVIFGGTSLKTRPELWEAFKHLRRARNNFAHQGRLMITKNGPELSSGEAASLLRAAEAIIDWCESQLPEKLRRPPRDTTTATEVLQSMAEWGSDGEFPVGE